MPVNISQEISKCNWIIENTAKLVPNSQHRKADDADSEGIRAIA